MTWREGKRFDPPSWNFVMLRLGDVECFFTDSADYDFNEAYWGFP